MSDVEYYSIESVDTSPGMEKAPTFAKEVERYQIVGWVHTIGEALIFNDPATFDRLEEAYKRYDRVYLRKIIRFNIEDIVDELTKS